MNDVDNLTLTFQSDSTLYGMREQNFDSMAFIDRLIFLKNAYHSDLNVRDCVNAYVVIRTAAYNALEYWDKTNNE
jgi:hypothetical protein